MTKHFLDKAKEDLKNKKKTDDEKGVLEKLLDIDEKVAHIMASDMLFAGVDTVCLDAVTILLCRISYNHVVNSIIIYFRPQTL